MADKDKGERWEAVHYKYSNWCIEQGGRCIARNLDKDDAIMIVRLHNTALEIGEPEAVIKGIVGLPNQIRVMNNSLLSVLNKLSDDKIRDAKSLIAKIREGNNLALAALTKPAKEEGD